MAIESKLVAKVVTEGADKASDQLDDFAKSAEGAEKSNDGLQKTLKAGTTIFKASAAAIVATSIAVASLAKKSAESEKNWNQLSLTARESVGDFKALSFATSQVGIEAEKLSDISKDVTEKLGEFIATGGGGFKDFFEQVAPQVGLTAKELQGLSGAEVLGRVQKAMEQANIPFEKQSFYLESIASDTTKLIPLLANESEKLKTLSERYKALNANLELSANQKEGISELAISFQLLEETASNAITFIVSEFAPEFNEYINRFASSLSFAASEATAFFDQFRDAENRSSITGIKREIAEITEVLDDYKKRNPNLFILPPDLAEQERTLEKLKQRLSELQSMPSSVSSAPIAASISGGGVVDTGIPSESELEQSLNNYIAFRVEVNKKIQEWDAEDARLTNDRVIREQQANAVILSSYSQLFGNVASLTAAFGDKQSNEYKVAFAAQQAFSIASAVAAINLAATQAAADPSSITLGQKLGNYGALIAALTPSVAAISSAGNFANGGIVGGNSYSGDRLTANVNSAEMILNQRQQASLFNMANSGGSGGIQIINQTTGRIDSAEKSMTSDGRIRVVIREYMSSEVMNPNSDFNKNMRATRRTQPILL